MDPFSHEDGHPDSLASNDRHEKNLKGDTNPFVKRTGIDRPAANSSRLLCPIRGNEGTDSMQCKNPVSHLKDLDKSLLTTRTWSSLALLKATSSSSLT
jgi:hypothetical protein